MRMPVWFEELWENAKPDIQLPTSAWRLTQHWTPLKKEVFYLCVFIAQLKIQIFNFAQNSRQSNHFCPKANKISKKLTAQTANVQFLFGQTLFCTYVVSSIMHSVQKNVHGFFLSYLLKINLKWILIPLFTYIAVKERIVTLSWINTALGHLNYF